MNKWLEVCGIFIEKEREKRSFGHVHITENETIPLHLDHEKSGKSAGILSHLIKLYQSQALQTNQLLGFPTNILHE